VLSEGDAMKKMMWSGGVSLALAVVLVATIGVTTPAPVTAESGARVCGYLLMPLLTGAPAKQDAYVVKNMAIMVEVPQDGDSLCDKGLEQILNGIKKDPKASPYYKGKLKLNNEKHVYDQWVYFEDGRCEKMGEYFGGAVNSKDICESGHPKGGMDRVSNSEGTHHSYTWTLAFYKMDSTGTVLGCDGKPASQTNAPCKETTPVLTKVTTSKK
jgi:hypothetical protein